MAGINQDKLFYSFMSFDSETNLPITQYRLSTFVRLFGSTNSCASLKTIDGAFRIFCRDSIYHQIMKTEK
jgi:hypothetical protein